MFSRTTLSAPLAALTLGCGQSTPPTYAQPIVATDGVAIGGFDTVAYHLEGAPQLGQASLAETWSGADWHFASAENRDTFRADPERYAPAYGGHCALATSLGKDADADPEQWLIDGGRLYLTQNAVASFLFSPPETDPGPLVASGD